MMILLIKGFCLGYWIGATWSWLMEDMPEEPEPTWEPEA